MRKRPQRALEDVLTKLSALPRIADLQGEITDANFAKRPAIRVDEIGEHGIDVIIDALETLLDHPADS